jgi:hypothetical protein
LVSKKNVYGFFSVPSKSKIEEAAGFSPEEVQLTWSQPTISNGPMEDLVYVIRWSTQTDKGLYEGEHEYNVSSSRSPYQRIISNLLPNHTYKFEVHYTYSTTSFTNSHIKVPCH